MIDATGIDSTQRLALGFVLAYFGAALSALLLTMGAAGIAAIWPASGIMLAGALVLKQKERVILYSGGFAASLVANLGIGAALWTAVGFSVANLAEVLVARFVISKFCSTSIHVAAPKNIFWAAIAAAAAAIVSAGTAAALTGNVALIFVVSWATTVFFGMTTISPAVLFVLIDWSRLSSTDKPILVLTSIIVAVVFGYAVWHADYPLLWAPLAATGYATYRLGLSGAGVSLLTLALMIATYSVVDASHDVGERFAAEKTLFLQFYLIGVLASLLPTAALLENHRTTLSDLRRSREIAENNAKLFQRASETDSLTGIPNRAKIFSYLDQSIRDVTKQHRDLSILMIDIDHFKQVNDRLGHAAGDKVLSIVAQICLSVSGEGAQVGRIGGEEFLYILKGYPIAEAEIFAERIRKELKAYDWDSEGLEPVTLSIGISGLAPGKAKALLLAEADARLYDAKNAGRDQLRAVA